MLAEAIGFDHYLVKPCDPKHVLSPLAAPQANPPLERLADPEATRPWFSSCGGKK